MNEDQLLRELGYLAKEEREAEQTRLDERWDRLAAGTLTPDEDAELRALAESSPEMREIYEAFQPLGSEFQARIVNKITSELQKASPLQKILSRILPFRPATLRPVGWLTAAATAAGLFLLVHHWPTVPPLPAYVAEPPTGGVQTSRGEPSTRIFPPGSTLSIIVRPQHPVAGKVEARAFLARGAEWIPWEQKIEVENGAVKLQGELSRQMQPGDWRLWVVAGRPGKLPPSAHDAEAEIKAGRIHHEQWQAVSADLRVQEQVPP